MIRTMQKVCPVLLRERAGRPELLAFRHPQAGTQLVKGTLESGEDIPSAALREFAEESGIYTQVDEGAERWSSETVVTGQIWHFVPAAAPALPDRFSFFTNDDGGHRFQFFW